MRGSKKRSNGPQERSEFSAALCKDLSAQSAQSAQRTSHIAHRTVAASMVDSPKLALGALLFSQIVSSREP